MRNRKSAQAMESVVGPGRPAGAAPEARWLSELVLHLHQIRSAVVVSAAALRGQNCELDDDIANVLQRSVADRIQDQIERVEGVLRGRDLGAIAQGSAPARGLVLEDEGNRLGFRFPL